MKSSAARFAAISTLISSPPPRLLQVTEELMAALQISKSVANGPPLTGTIGNPPLTASVDLGHKCPACKSTILFGHLSVAVCSRGHSWGKSFIHTVGPRRVRRLAQHFSIERCSATFAIIDVPAERTCMGCCRRTLLPSSTDEVGDWVSHEVLKASSFCLCGSRYACMV